MIDHAITQLEHLVVSLLEGGSLEWAKMSLSELSGYTDAKTGSYGHSKPAYHPDWYEQGYETGRLLLGKLKGESL